MTAFDGTNSINCESLWRSLVIAQGFLVAQTTPLCHLVLFLLKFLAFNIEKVGLTVHFTPILRGLLCDQLSVERGREFGAPRIWKASKRLFCQASRPILPLFVRNHCFWLIKRWFILTNSCLLVSGLWLLSWLHCMSVCVLFRLFRLFVCVAPFLLKRNVSLLIFCLSTLFLSAVLFSTLVVLMHRWSYPEFSVEKVNQKVRFRFTWNALKTYSSLFSWEFKQVILFLYTQIK